MAKSYQAGLSTVGTTLSWGVETSPGIKPEVFKVLHRINEIGEIAFSAETIDASALEDEVERDVAGRASTGSSWDVSFNLTDETAAEWKELIAAYKALSGGKRMWFQQIVRGLTDADFVVAQPLLHIPSPSKGQNEILVCTMPMTVEEYVGLDTKVTPTDDAE